MEDDMDFYAKLKDILDCEDEISDNTNLLEINGFDSLSIVSIMFMLNQDYGVALTADDIRNIGTAYNLKILVDNKIGS